MAVEAGLIGQPQDPTLGDCPDSYASLETSGLQEACSNPTSKSYDAANPYAHPPPPPEHLPEPLPGPGVRPFYQLLPDASQGDNSTKYNTGWYAPRHGPYPPMPYISPPYHYPYPVDPCGPTLHLQSEHAIHGDTNAPQYHNAYYNGASDPYPSYPGHPHYFYPPHHPLPHAGSVTHPDGHETTLPGACHPPNDPRGNKEVPPKDTQNA